MLRYESEINFIERSYYCVLIGVLVYELVFKFNTVGGLSYLYSLIFLLIMTLLFVLINALSVRGWHTRLISSVMAVIMALGLFTAISDLGEPRFIEWLWYAGVVFLILFGITIIAWGLIDDLSTKLLLRMSYLFIKLLGTGVCLMILAFSVYKFRFAPVPVIEDSILSEDSDEETFVYTMDNQKETLKLLNDWDNLDRDSKIEIIKTVYRIEASDARIDSKITIVFKSGMGTTLGTYDHHAETITLSTRLLEEYDGYDVVDVVCHEFRHRIQHKYVDEYRKLPMDQKKLWVWKKTADIYRYEMIRYQNGEEGDFSEYYNQEIERESRLYAAVRTLQYEEYVKSITSE